MGKHNVTKVFRYWSHLNHREVRALVYMANESRDDESPPRYWGGWEQLAASLGANVVGDPESARRTAVRALGALSAAGAIVSSGQARSGVRAEYALTLDEEVLWVPSGSGRNISWSPAVRDGGIVRPDGAPETATVTQPETATVTQPETARVLKVRQLGVPLVKRSLNTELEMENHSFQVGNLRATAKRQSANNSQRLTQQQELERQTRQLLDKYPEQMIGKPDERKARMARKVRRGVRGRQAPKDGAGVAPG